MTQLLVYLLAFSAFQDPLFEKMQGHWHGEGERTFAPRGRKVKFEADVVSRVVGDRLVSENKIRETPGKEYVRIYWIRPHAVDPGKYELGYGEGADSTVFSNGQFDPEKNVFVVIQKMGGEGGLVFHSETEFLSSGETQYTQIDSYGDTQAAHTSVRYVRVAEEQQ